MGCRKYICVFILGVLVMGGLFVPGEASSLDKYRTIMASKSYTFKCHTFTPNLKGMRIRFDMDEDYYMSEKMANDTQKLQRETREKIDRGEFKRPYEIIVMDGDTRYTEVRGGWCKLLKNGEVFTYLHNIMDDSYIAMRKSKRGYLHRGEIAPGENNWPTRGIDNKLTSQADIEDVGNDLLMKLLAVIYPVSSANVELPNYHFVSSGTAQDGSSYEDYAGEMNGLKHVVRCYFKGGSLVKMGYASYPQNGDRSKENVEKYVIEIVEFTNVPEEKYLVLPASLKVVRD